MSKYSEDENKIAAIAAGDFNESHDEQERVDGAYKTAFSINGNAEEDGTLPVCSLEDIGRKNSPCFYNPWLDSAGKGSYYYKGSWETIDQFFMNSAFLNGSDWEYASFDTVRLEFNTGSDGCPLSWNSGTGTGSSDHLPIILEIVLEGNS